MPVVETTLEQRSWHCSWEINLGKRLLLLYNDGGRREKRKMGRNIRGEIQELLYRGPAMTVANISEELRISKATCKECLNQLIEKKEVYSFKAKNSGRIYYAIDEGMTVDDLENMRKVMKEETVNAKDAYDDLEEKYDEVSKNVNGLYANIISIIFVFVAIFALITVNANITFKLTQENMYDVFWGIIEVNIFVVICIVILLVVTRVLIINPLLGKNKKKKDKRG